MHEIGFVDDVLRAINVRLKALKKSSRVKRVNILIGELEHITLGHFEFHFRERTKGTPLESAELIFKKIEIRFRCKECRYEFSAEEGLDGCPNCKSKVNDIISGTGVFVESVEID